LLHAFHELDRVIHLPVSKVEALLKRFFLWRGKPQKMSILKLDANEWTAFVLNNWRLLRDEFRKIDVEQAIQGSLDIENIRENEFSIPLTERYTYNPKLLDTKDVTTNVYKNYTTATTAVRPSQVERLMERWLEGNKNLIDFVYKNGDKGPQYFSLVYSTNGGASHFYPDYIVQTKNNEIIIIETKGGEDAKGNDKNIDPYAPAKFVALQKYVAKYNVKGIFVRDMNDELFYLENGEWSDRVSNSFWRPIDKFFYQLNKNQD